MTNIAAWFEIFIMIINQKSPLGSINLLVNIFMKNDVWVILQDANVYVGINSILWISLVLLFFVYIVGRINIQSTREIYA